MVALFQQENVNFLPAEVVYTLHNSLALAILSLSHYVHDVHFPLN